MAITTTITRKTGIYQETRTTANDQAGIREILKGLADRENIFWQLDRIEEAALQILHHGGITAWPYRVPTDADPILKDASNAALRARTVRKALADGNAGLAAISALQLGYIVERMGVRPWEAHAARGLKTLRAAQKSHAHTHGTTEEKQARWQKYQEDVDLALETEPNLTYNWACARVAAKHSVTSRTVRNHTNAPSPGLREEKRGKCRPLSNDTHATLALNAVQLECCIENQPVRRTSRQSR